MVEIQYRPARRRMLEATYPSIAVLPGSGLHVAIDETSPSPISSTCGGQRAASRTGRVVDPADAAPERLPEAVLEPQEHVVGGGRLTR